MIYLRLIWSYLKIGFFGFGGGYAMLALIENEIVTPGWITEQMFTDIVAISQMWLPQNHQPLCHLRYSEYLGH